MRFHVDAAVGVKYSLEIPDAIKRTFLREIKQAVHAFIDWVKAKAAGMNYPEMRKVPVYLPSRYKYPRKEGRTNELRKSLTASFRTRLEPDIYWDTPYASYVLAHGKVRTPGTSAKWPSKLKHIFSMWLRHFLREKLGRGVASLIKISSEADN